MSFWLFVYTRLLMPHIYYRLLGLMHIEAYVKTVVCGLHMAVVDVDSHICIAGHVCGCTMFAIKKVTKPFISAGLEVLKL